MPPSESDSRRDGDQRDDLRHIEDMIIYATDAVEYLDGMDLVSFQRDRMRQHAVIRCIEVIGEASRNVSETTVAAHGSVDWRAIYGMRNRLAHDYGGIDIGIVYQVGVEYLPDLLPKLEVMLNNLQEQFGNQS